MGTWWVVTNDACMGHSDRVNKRVHETSGMRWAGRDTMDETGTHQQSSHVLTRSDCYSWKPVRRTFWAPPPPPPPPPRASFQSPHLTENTCHEKSDFYIIIMIIVYVHYTEKVPWVVQKCNPRHVELVIPYQSPGADLWI